MTNDVLLFTLEMVQTSTGVRIDLPYPALNHYSQELCIFNNVQQPL